MRGASSGTVSPPCPCEEPHESPKFIVLTGGPGAGKTAVLEVIRKNFCRHVQVLPESATILFKGGFPRINTRYGKESAQRAIFHVQRELERQVHEARDAAVAVCDRGTVDGLAYWPSDPESFFRDLGTTREQEFLRYAMVIHVRPPPAEAGYTRANNPVRTESAHEAMEIDDRILHAWTGHPARVVVEHTRDFLTKAAEVVRILKTQLPECCRQHLA